MKFSYDYSKSFFLINKELTRDLWLRKSGAQRGYSMDMFSRMYDSIFSELIDVEREYTKYYSFEYTKLEQFLYKKYNLSPEDIEEIMELRKANPDYSLFKKDDYSYGDYGIMHLAFSESMIDRVTDMLILKNGTYENTI